VVVVHEARQDFAGKPMMPSAGEDHSAEAIGTRWSSMNIGE